MQKSLQLIEQIYQDPQKAKQINTQNPDPIMIAKRYNDEYIALFCALFAYGNIKAICRFLDGIDFSALATCKEEALQTKGLKYRFQNEKDIEEFARTLITCKQKTSLKSLFWQGYCKNKNTMQGIMSIIDYMYSLNPYRSRGYEFLLGKQIAKKDLHVDKIKSTTGAYKRFNMFVRWMVRCDEIDMGLWSTCRHSYNNVSKKQNKNQKNDLKKIEKKDLIIPLDTHTHKIGLKLGLITNKSSGLKSALELTNALKNLDPDDPVKYDFTLFRMGLEKLI